MRLIGSWGRRSLIVGFGRRGGGLGGRMGGVIEEPKIYVYVCTIMVDVDWSLGEIGPSLLSVHRLLLFLYY